MGKAELNLRVARKRSATEDQTDLRWFAIRVQPQKEQIAARILRDRNFVAATPTEERFRRVNRHAKSKTAFRFPVAPGYVFLAFPPGPIPWGQITRFHIVNSIVGYYPPTSRNDRFPCLVPLQLNKTRYSNEAIARMFGKNFGQAPELHKYMRTYGEYEEGDEIRIVSGPYEGFHTKVESLTAREAKVLLEIFGSTHEVSIPVDAAVKAA